MEVYKVSLDGDERLSELFKYERVSSENVE